MGWVHHSWISGHVEALREVGPEMPERGSKTSTVPASEQIWNFFGAIKMISCRDWWPWTKRGHITMTRRQSNDQWSGDIVAHPHPTPQKKNSSAKIRWKSSRLDFLGSRLTGWLTDFLTYLLTYSLTCSFARSLHGAESLLEQLMGPHLVKKYPAFYGIWRFITAFISAHHLSLSFIH